MAVSMVRTLRLVLVTFLLLAPSLAGGVTAEPGELRLHDPVTVRAAAVAHTDRGLVGSLATVSITLAENGTGHVFLDTVPLTQMDMQGSARFAVRVAGAVTGMDVREYDFFFTVRSGSQIIGGPSAGAIMTVGVIAALKGWPVDESVMMTGTINPDGTVGPVGGVPEKAAAAARGGAVRFLFPEGQGRMADGRNLPDYCERSLGIRCEAVSDVEEAVAAVTGYAFERPPLRGNVTDETFRRTLAPLAEDLVENATRLLGEADAAFEAARDRLPPSAAADLEEALRVSEGSLGEAEAAIGEGAYYAAASKSFMASIRARYVRDAAEGALADDPGAHLRGVLDAMDAHVARAARETRAAEASSLVLLQAVGAAQARATEAETRAEKAWGAYRAGDVLGAYDEAAYALERARTAPWWLRIGHAFDAGAEGAAAPPDPEDAARAYLDNARQSVTYAEVILEEMGVDAAVAGEPRRLLDAATADAERGFHAAALFQAIEAEVRANLILEVVSYGGAVPEGRLDRARERAEHAIQESRDLGVEPLLAMSYYEFAGSLGESSDAIVFYNLARTTGKLARFLTAEPAEPTASRFVGDSQIGWWNYRMPISWGAGFFALGLAFGLGGGIAAVIGGPSSGRGKVPSRTLEPSGPPGSRVEPESRAVEVRER